MKTITVLGRDYSISMAKEKIARMEARANRFPLSQAEMQELALLKSGLQFTIAQVILEAESL